MPKAISLGLGSAIAALIALGSLGPFNLRDVLLMHSQRELNIVGLFHLNMHRIVHLVAFGSLTLILCLSAHSARGRAAWCVAVIVFALSIEIGEYVPYSNPFEIWDLRDDAIASAVGLSLTYTKKAIEGLRRAYQTKRSTEDS